MTVPTLPTPPNRSQDQATFDTNIAAWIAAIDAWTVAVNAMGITTLTGSIQSTPIGNVTPSTGAFTTLSATNRITVGNIGLDGTADTFATIQNSSYPTFAHIYKSSIATVAGNNFLDLYICTGDGTNTHVTRTSPTGLAVTGTISATSTIKTGGYTVATLPAGTTGDRAYVTDATAPTYLGALTGGGAVVCPVFKNASAWVSA